MIDSSKVVLDASALLAAIQQETGGDKVQDVIEHAVISSVNWSEVLQKLQRVGVDTDAMTEAFYALGFEVVPFTVEDAKFAAELWPVSKSKGLSLADRSCLALGASKSFTSICLCVEIGIGSCIFTLMGPLF